MTDTEAFLVDQGLREAADRLEWTQRNQGACAAAARYADGSYPDSKVTGDSFMQENRLAEIVRGGA